MIGIRGESVIDFGRIATTSKVARRSAAALRWTESKHLDHALRRTGTLRCLWCVAVETALSKGFAKGQNSCDPRKGVHPRVRNIHQHIRRRAGVFDPVITHALTRFPCIKFYARATSARIQGACLNGLRLSSFQEVLVTQARRVHTLGNSKEDTTLCGINDRAAAWRRPHLTGCRPPASPPRAARLILTGVFAGRTTSSPRAMKVE